MSGASPTESGQEVQAVNSSSEPNRLASKPPSSDSLPRMILDRIRSVWEKKGHNPGETLQEIASSSSETPGEIEKRVLSMDTPPSRHDVVAYMQAYPNRLRSFSQVEGQWEVVTSELVNGLTDYFAKRASELVRSEQDPLVIAEVGAGSGRLAFFIRKALETRGLNKIITYSASDVQPELGKPKTQADSILKGQEFRYNTSYVDGLMVDNKPADVVLAVWPDPKVNGVPGTEWTKDFRLAGVGEYILIGNPRVCGDMVDTWGITTDDMTERVPAYKTDGFGYQKVDVIDPFLAQIPLLGGSDNPSKSPEGTSSQIAVFRKESSVQAA